MLGRRVVPEVPVKAALEVVVGVRRVLDVREVEVRLEHRHEREVEREREEDRERHDDGVGHAFLAPRHQVTCARRAKNSIPDADDDEKREQEQGDRGALTERARVDPDA